MARFGPVGPDVNVGPNTACAAKPGKPGSLKVGTIELVWMVSQAVRLGPIMARLRVVHSFIWMVNQVLAL